MLFIKLKRLNLNHIALLLLTIFGFILRIYNLGYQSLWFDEGYTINAARAILNKGFPILPSGFFYYRGLLNTALVALSMSIFGITEFSARLPSVFFGVITIPLIYFFVRKLFDNKTALSTAFLITFSIVEIAWSRQARMYQQLQFFYILSLYFFYNFTQEQNSRNLIIFITSTISAILSHELGFSLILVYILYPLIKNIRNVRSYLKPKLLLSKPIFPLLFIGVTLLILGEVFFGLFSTTWQTRVNYFPNYLWYIQQYFFIIAYFAVVGIVIILRKDYKVALFLGLATTIPIYFVSFHVKLLAFRYIYFLLPLLFILFSNTALYISILVPRLKLRAILSSVLLMAILLLTVISSGFNFIPKSEYDLEYTAPQPDFKQAYSFINDNSEKQEIVIDTWPAIGSFYLDRPPDYWLGFDITGQGENYCIGEFNTVEIYTKTPCIEDLAKLRRIVEENSSGWLIVDGLAILRLPSDIVGFIEQNLIYCEQGSKQSRSGIIKVYRWDHEV